ncbi:MAG: hypothetical protein QMD04_00295 [Anaerolineales bacterium]|nr:hypothetical protein [Anaerolineales bacterium]
MKQDRFLLGILIFIGLLIVAALTLFFVRQDAQTYGAEDTPEGVIRNYALALQNRDFERAYGYLAEKDNRPSLDTFRQAFLSRQLDISNAAIQIGSVELTGSDQAMVDLTVVYASSDPFSTGWSSNETATLVRQEGGWRISYMPYPYWGWDWFQPTAVPVKP